MENILVQIIVTVAGGFVLDRLLAVYKNRFLKKNKNDKVSRLAKFQTLYKNFCQRHPFWGKCGRGIRYGVCFLLAFEILNIFSSIHWIYIGGDKDWVYFQWIMFEDDSTGDSFLSGDREVYIREEDTTGQLVARQTYDTTLIQVYYPDFTYTNPNIIFSNNNKYLLVTENRNVNIFNAVSGELMNSFLIRDGVVTGAVFLEEDKKLFLVTTKDNDCRVSEFDMDKGIFIQEKFWPDTVLIGENREYDYYFGMDTKEWRVFAAGFSDLNSEPVYGKEALSLSSDDVNSYYFDEEGKYYVELTAGATGRLEVMECSSGNILFYMNVYEMSDFFFDKQDNIYVVHQGKVDRINLPGGQRKTIIDLDAMGEQREKKWAGNNRVFVRTCMIYDSGYLAGIVSDESHSRCRIYIFDLEAEKIKAVSNPIGDIGEDGYAWIMEAKDVLYAGIKNDKGNSALRYPLSFDENRKLLFFREPLILRILNLSLNLNDIIGQVGI